MCLCGQLSDITRKSLPSVAELAFKCFGAGFAYLIRFDIALNSSVPAAPNN